MQFQRLLVFHGGNFWENVSENKLDQLMHAVQFQGLQRPSRGICTSMNDKKIMHNLQMNFAFCELTKFVSLFTN